MVGELTRRFAPDPVIKAGLDSAFADDVDVPDEFVDDLDGMTFSAYDKSSAEAQDSSRTGPTRSAIKEARVPLLVIFGTEDEIVDPEAADAWKKDVPRARVVKMRGVGHSPHWERPREVVDCCSTTPTDRGPLLACPPWQRSVTRAARARRSGTAAAIRWSRPSGASTRTCRRSASRWTARPRREYVCTRCLKAGKVLKHV